jgi:transposase
VGEGMGQRGCVDRSGGALRATEVWGSASAVGGGANLFLALGQNRRMSKDYERLPESSEAFVYVAMSRLMVRRLARS